MADLEKAFLDIIDNRIQKYVNAATSSFIKQRLAVVIDINEDTNKAFVYFIDDEKQTRYSFYNKSGENLEEGDTVKVFYTTNVAKGWIGERNGSPNINNNNNSNSDNNWGNAITEYNYLSDMEVKFNGTVYTIEKDTETGLISKIKDDKGNGFEPQILGKITDVALHNAVFWAVAMARGLRPKVDAFTAMCAYRYNCDSMAQSGTNITWHNQAAGGNVDCTLHDAEIIDNHIRLYGRNTSYGYISSIAMSMQGYTVYLVAQAINVVSPCRTMCIRAGIEFLGNGGYWLATRGINSNYVTSEIPATQLCVLVAAVYSDGAMRWWINGAEQTSPGSSNSFSSSAVDIRRTLDNYFDGSTIDYYDIAFADAPHVDSEIAANSAYLMQKYNILN